MAYKALYTETGLQKLAQAIANSSTVNLTEMAIGDANNTPYEPDGTETTLVHETWRGNLTSLYIDPNDPTIVIATSVVPINVGNFNILEVGLFDSDGDLIVIANYPETYKNLVSEGAVSEYHIRIEMKINNTDLLTLAIDPSIILATQEYVDQKFDEAKISTFDEGSLLTDFTKSYNFVGDGVEATHDGNGNITVSILNSTYYREDKIGLDGVNQGNGYYRFTLSKYYRVGANNDLIVFRGNILHRGTYDFDSPTEAKDYVEVGSFGDLSCEVDIKGASSPYNNLAFFISKQSEEGIEPSQFMFFREFKLGSQGTYTGGKYRYVLTNNYTPGNNGLFVFKGGQLLRLGSTNDYEEPYSNGVDLIDSVLSDNHLQFVNFDTSKFQREHLLGSQGVINGSNYRFTLTSTSYNVGSGNLFIWKGGQLLTVNQDYIEIDSTNFELFDEVIADNHITVWIPDLTYIQRADLLGSDKTIVGTNYRYTLPFNYITGSHRLFVFKGGALLRLHYDYSEVSSNTIDLFDPVLDDNNLSFVNVKL